MIRISNPERTAVEGTEGNDGRSQWVRPELRRLRAGAAETGSTVVTDLGVTYS
jgi:hypothetical protein